MRSRLAATLVVIAVAAALVAGSDAATLGGAGTSAASIPLLRVGAPPESNLDSFRSTQGSFVARLGVETLMQLAPDGSVKPLLAQSVSHPNPFVYIYTLRKGVKFWDGNELTAVDAANALNYYRAPGSLAAFAFGGSSIRFIKATGKYTVEVNLKRVDASFPFVAANAALRIFEKSFGDAHPGTMGQPTVGVMGTGPWKVDSFSPTSGAELSANPNYWGGKPQIAHISVKFFADETSEALAFRNGDIDMTAAISGAQAFAATSGAKLLTSRSPNATIFYMNTSVPPFNDVHLRRAVAYALYRTDIATAYGGLTHPTNYLINPVLLRSLGSSAQVNATLKSVPTYPFSLAKAKEEMAKSAYANGVTISTPSVPIYSIQTVDQVLAAELQPLGITVKTTPMSVGVWFGAITGAADQRPSGFTYIGCVSPDPGKCYDFLLGSKNTAKGKFNLAVYTPASVDSLLAQGYETANPAKRLAIYGRLLKVLGTDVPYVPLFTQDTSIALSSKFSWPTFSWHFTSSDWALGIKPS